MLAARPLAAKPRRRRNAACAGVHSMPATRAHPTNGALRATRVRNSNKIPRREIMRIRDSLIAAFVAGACFAQTALGADACRNRGELDVMYCDENGDLVADAPKDPKHWK